jgi:alkylation response protein AidB-like acyl-CoA dehydrogenase
LTELEELMMDDRPPAVTTAAAGAAARAAAGAATADRERRLGHETVEALTAAGFARHFVPAGWGGGAGGFGALVEAAATVAEGCPSAAWCGMLWAAHGRFAAFLPSEGQRNLWGGSPDVRVAAAVMPPSGVALPTSVDGGDGWSVSGEWHTASGVDHSDWVLLGAWEQSGDDGAGSRARVLAVPVAGPALAVKDTWNSVGLRGTGSNTVVSDGLFVPRHRSFVLADLLRGTGARGTRARCHTVPAQLAGGLMFAAPALGAARAALRVWSDWAGEAATDGGRANHDSASVRETLLRSSGETDAAGLLLTEAARRADTEPVTDLLVARNRRDAAVATDLLVTSVERLLRTGGVHLRDACGDLQRLWRDVHTVAAHGVLRLEPVAEAYAGTVFAGGRQAPGR